MSLRLKFPYHKEPPKGWHWIRDGIEFRADSPEAVIAKVKKHLITNGRCAGDLMEEFVSYVAAHWPNLVKESHAPDPLTLEDPLWKVLDNQHRLAAVSLLNVPEKAEGLEREKLCAACPMNRRMRGDVEVLEAINRRAFLLTRGNLNKLGYCKQYLWDNRVATVWDKDLLKKISQPKADSPVPCWF